MAAIVTANLAGSPLATYSVTSTHPAAPANSFPPPKSNHLEFNHEDTGNSFRAGLLEPDNFRSIALRNPERGKGTT